METLTKDIIALVFSHRAGELVEQVESWIFEVRVPKDYVGVFKEMAIHEICKEQEGALKDILGSALEGADWKTIAHEVYHEAKNRVNDFMLNEGHDDGSDPLTWENYRG